ncbi:hypothetical protein [Alicyclobacillus contaminans]|uniref:hypothetical protein n=1 Tax=Alicyclobacillus contaminans TaxID=392016 RepID=UPI00047DA11E|nr:hypothetical protein [Alicyclobacillus contaminans]
MLEVICTNVHESFDELIVDVTKASYAIRAELEATLVVAAERVKQTAQSKFGEYQPAIGPYVAWALLNPDYVMRKGAEDPLIGRYSNGSNSMWPTALKDSIETHVDKTILEAHIGTNSPLGKWHEFGLPGRKTPLPPRPFLRPALHQETDWILSEVEKSIGGVLPRLFK